MKVRISVWPAVAAAIAGAVPGLEAQTALKAAATVNVRSGPGGSYGVLGRIPAGFGTVGIAQVTASGTNIPWWRIWFDGRTAYTKASYYTSVSGATGAKVASDAMNIRSGPGTTYAIVGRAYRNQIYRKVATSGAWHKIDFAGARRWIHGSGVALVALLGGPPPPPPPVVTAYALRDSFSRREEGGWGRAEAGGAWSLGGNGVEACVDGDAGSFVLPQAGSSFSAVAASPTGLDVDLAFRVKTTRFASGGGLYVYGLARRTSGGSSEYRAKVRFTSDRRIFVGAGVVVSGREQPVGGEIVIPGLLHTPHTFVRVRATVTGKRPTTLRVKAWADGSPEPADWPYVATDSADAAQVAGLAGLMAYVSSSATALPVAVLVDDFRAGPPGSQPAATPLPADAKYVSPSGDDANDGSAARPWRTLQRAANAAAPGMTVVVRGGTHAGFFLSRSGTASAPVTFRGYPGETAVLDGNPSNTNTILVRTAGHVVIRDLTVRGSVGGQSAGIRLENGCSNIRIQGCTVRDNQGFGVKVYKGSYVTVEDNDVSHNATGIDINYDGAGCVVRNNRVHHTDKMVRNTADVKHDDYGGDGITFTRTAGPILATGNRIWSNRAASYDYGWDGGAFSTYAGGGVTIEDNVMWDNENVLETGTDNGNPSPGIRFLRNVAYGALSAPGGRLYGMFLRSAENMLVAHNTFHDIEWVFSVMAIQETFRGSIEGLRITNNAASARVKVWGIEGSVPASVVIDRNLSFNPTGGWIGSVSGKGHTNSLAQFTAWCGYETTGVQADPRFRNAAAHDFRLAPGSPAVDRGVRIAGLNDNYRGTAPDLGRYEK